VTARRAGAAGCGGACGLGRARGHLEQAVAQLEAARLAWGVWSYDIRQLAEQHLGISDLLDERVLDDPGYGRALDIGGQVGTAVTAAAAALRAAGGEGCGGVCPCTAIKAQIGSPHP
jgi:hypothetical protein